MGTKYMVFHSGHVAGFVMNVDGKYASTKEEARNLVAGWIERHAWQTTIDRVVSIDNNQQTKRSINP